MKKQYLIKKLLIGGLVLSSVVGNSSSVFALESKNNIDSIQESIQDNYSNLDVLNKDHDVIDISDNYVNVNLKTKKLEISNPDELKSKLSQDEYDYISNCVTYVNELIENDEVSVMDNGTMYFTSELMARGGKINHSEVKYWGIRRYNNQANTTKAANTLLKNGKAFKNSTKVPSSLLILIGLAGVGTAAATVIAAIGIGAAFGNWMYNVGNQLKKKNNKYGTVLDISWNASYKVWKQTSSTK